MIKSKIHKKLLPVIGAALMGLALAAPAQAVPPDPPYSQFAGCPDTPEVEICLRTEIVGGHFQMGNKDVPINKVIPLTGGTDANFQNFSFNSEGGLKPVPLEVPGGVIGLTGLDWLVNFLSLEQLKLYAVTELAGTPDLNLFEEPLELPIKVRLVNVALGNKCYVGSNANPIMLNMQLGETNPPPPNEPITGTPPKISFDENEITHINEGTWVDNSFAAPGANGCNLLGSSLIPINGVINIASGLPSPAGTNETTQDLEIEATDRVFVYP